MTLEEIKTTLSLIEEKVTDIKNLISDIDVCASEKSKTILLAAASKMATVLTAQDSTRQ